jgi:eukaryotic-like serine/threonine-protein kinase
MAHGESSRGVYHQASHSPCVGSMIPLEDFIAHVALSGLVSPVVVAQVKAQIEPEPASDAAVRMARRLIDGGWLTLYQARKLLSGATRGFFLGGYRLMRPLGEGGMGKVYLAVNDQQEKAAIKVLPPRKALEEENALKRFHREMRLSQRCFHPNLARTISVGNDGDVHFMVMEYIPGKSLFDLVKNDGVGPLRVPDAARLFLKLIDGLEAAHKCSLVHRDIKPSNIMITPEGDAKLLDMGLARALDDETGLTRANTVLGTLDYASPEQLRDAAKADARSDLYSVGCTLYFAVAGTAPFEGGDMINKIFKQRMEDPPPLEDRARGVPAAFAAVVRKLMSKNPDERYQSCAELRNDLVRWTNPALVRAILGAEADGARSFRPPPPQLEEDDLRLLTDDVSLSRDSLSLRDLGTAEPSFAPRHQVPAPPMPVKIRSRTPAESTHSAVRSSPSDDNRWLVQYAIIAGVLGLLAILVIAIFLRS